MVAATPGVSILRSFIRLSSIMAIGVILSVIGNSLMGFCPLFDIHHSISYIWVGLVLLGIALSLMNASFMPYIVHHYETHPL